MKKFITNKIALSILGILLFLLLWWLISFLIGHGDRIFPDPWSTIWYAFYLLNDPYTYLCIGYSLLRMIIGFVIALILGVIIGGIAGNVRKSKYLFNPSIVALKTVPTAALLYLFMVLMGATNAPILIVTLICFPIIYEGTLGGYTNINEDVRQSLRLENNGRLHKNIKVIFPLALPYIFVAILSSFSLSFKIEIMAEVISGSTNPGLGAIIHYSQQNNPADLLPVFGYAFIAICLMLIVSFVTSIIINKLKLEK